MSVLARESIVVFWEPFVEPDGVPTSIGAAASMLGRYDEFAAADYVFWKLDKPGHQFIVHDMNKNRCERDGLPFVKFDDSLARRRLGEQFPGLTFGSIYFPPQPEKNTSHVTYPGSTQIVANFTDDAFVIFKLVYQG